MALIDDPQTWILRLFEMEEREGRGEHCQRFPEGARPDELSLDDGERVFGIYKNRYFFTPISLHIRQSKGISRIPWNDIIACSTEHGDGRKIAELTLTDGSTLKVRIGDLVTGWSGRISQLFHQMIQRHGNRASLGPRLMTIEEFFAAANDDYCLFPNLEPHPRLSELREALVDLRNRPEVADVLVSIIEVEDGFPAADGLIVRTSSPTTEFEDFASTFRAVGIFAASENHVRQLRDLRSDENVWHIFWD
jgi:hypothetical protein